MKNVPVPADLKRHDDGACDERVSDSWTLPVNFVDEQLFGDSGRDPNVNIVKHQLLLE
jgi:hypothetical protein